MGIEQIEIFSKINVGKNLKYIFMAKVAILICSCDFYSECWEPIIFSFKKYWPDCEYDKLIVSNNKDVKISGAKIIKVGDHKGWASDTLKAVGMTDYDYYIYFQEDYWLNQRVDNGAIKAHIQHCIDNKIDYLKLGPDRPSCDKHRIGTSDYCKNPMDHRYAICTVVSIWSRELFEKVCVPGHTGWDFEYKIVPYINENHIEFNSEALHTSVIPTKSILLIRGNAIQRGKWTPPGVKFLKENGFADVLKQRDIQNKFYSFIFYKMPERYGLVYPKLAILRLLRILNIN